MSNNTDYPPFEELFHKKKPAMAPFEFWEKTVEWLFVKQYFSPALIAAPLSGNAELAADAVLKFVHDSQLCLIEFKRREIDFKSEREKYPFYGAAKWKDLPVERRSGYETNFRQLLERYGTKRNTPHLFVYGLLKPGKFIDLVNSRREEAGQALQNGSIAGAAKALLGTLTDKEALTRQTLKLDVEAKPYWGPWVNADKFTVPELQSARKNVKLSELHKIGWKFDAFNAYVTSLVAAKGRKPDDDPSGPGWESAMIMAVSSDGSSLTFSVFEFIEKFVVGLKPGKEKEMQIGAPRKK